MEVLQSHSAPAPTCPCGDQMVRLVAASNFSLQGSGWYKDGYGLRGDKPAPAGKGKPAAGKP